MGWVDLVKHRLIFRALFRREDGFYTSHNPEFGEDSPSNANIHFGIKKENAMNASKSFVSSNSLVFKSHLNNATTRTESDANNRSLHLLINGLGKDNSPLMSPVSIQRTNSKDSNDLNSSRLNTSISTIP